MILNKKKRWEILAELLKRKNIKPKVGAEIGILAGNMTTKVLQQIPSIVKYYAIDPWEWYPSYMKSLRADSNFVKNMIKSKDTPQEKFDEKFEIFKQKTIQFQNKIKILKMYSKEASEHIEDKSLDFLFIDGNHGYEYVKEDIELYSPKIKRGCLIGGHDYGHVVGGVKEAVNEIFESEEIILGGNSTWWVWV